MITSRRKFLQVSGALAAAMMATPFPAFPFSKKVLVGAHLWVYASNFPPDWDCTPVIEDVFRDLQYAGIEGLEVMHANLRHPNSVQVLRDLAEKYNLPVIGSSYGADMWNQAKHVEILAETEMYFEKLQALNAKVFGISVGDPGRKKSEEELDHQAEILMKVRASAKTRGITCNLHNHTYEVINNMHDLRSTLKRIPDFPLGPDLNWLIRGGVDPVSFITEFGNQIVYMHLRDQHANGEWSEALGEGETDLAAIAAALQKVNFSGMATIELAFPGNFKPTRPLKDSWKMSRQVVRQQFGF